MYLCPPVSIFWDPGNPGFNLVATGGGFKILTGQQHLSLSFPPHGPDRVSNRFPS